MNTVAPSRNVSAPTPQRVWSPSVVNIYKKLYEKSDKKLKEHICNVLLEIYDQNVKPLQVNAVFNLAQGRNTFLNLAGTGFGKSRIPQLYHKLFPQKARAVVLVLNPLDTLGDNQVSEKLMAGFTAINLTKQSFTNKAANEVLAGVYDFVYLSPEMFLNSKKFEKVYYIAAFQNLIALVFVDEAHMIYIWGLVASGTAKTSTLAHHRFEDYGLFRPLYGKLGPQLLFRNNKPMLLLSATCRPVAIEAIKVSLKMNDETVDML
jgi:superfamily II DNA helicase RecQ